VAEPFGNGYEFSPQVNTIITDQNTPLTDGDAYIGTQGVPLVGQLPIFAPIGTASWSLVNLIMSVAGIILAVYITVRVLLLKKREREADERELYSPEDEHKEKPYRLICFATATVLSVLAVIIFVITQDMSNVMVLVDWLTLPHAIILATLIANMMLVIKRKKKDRTEHSHFAPPLSRASSAG